MKLLLLLETVSIRPVLDYIALMYRQWHSISHLNPPLILRPAKHSNQSSCNRSFIQFISCSVVCCSFVYCNLAASRQECKWKKIRFSKHGRKKLLIKNSHVIIRSFAFHTWGGENRSMLWINQKQTKHLNPREENYWNSHDRRCRSGSFTL